MKIKGLIALKDFNTHIPGGVLRAKTGAELPPVNYSIAERLIKGGYARRKRRKARKESDNGS